MTLTTPRQERRRAQAALTREQVLDAAERLFGRHGYRETSLRQVAEACGLSVGALYLHLDGKEALLRAVIDRRGLVLMSLIRSFVEADGPAVDRLLALVRAEIEFYRSHRDFGRLVDRLYSSGLPTVELHADISHGYTAAMQMEAEIIRAGQRDGTIRTGNADSLARLLGAMVGAYRADDAAHAAVSADGAGGNGETGGSRGADGAGLPDGDFLDIVYRAFAAAPPP